MIKKIKNFFKNYFFYNNAYLFFIKNWTGIADIQSARNLICAMRHSHGITADIRDQVAYKSILIIAPHPDDELIGCGGALIKCKEQGGRVQVLYLTRGSRSQQGEVVSEIKKSADFLGYEQFFLDFYSKDIKIDFSLVDYLAQHINKLNPDAIFLPFLLDDHDDHRVASHLLYLAAQKNLLKWKGPVWAYQVYTVLHANVYLNITDVIDQKSQAISFLMSQLKKRDWIHYVKGLNAFNSRFATHSSQKYLEAYFVLPIADYMTYCKTYFASGSRCYEVAQYNQAQL